MGEKTRVRIRSSSLQSASMGGLDAHLSFFTHLPHLGPSGGDFKASRRNCILGVPAGVLSEVGLRHVHGPQPHEAVVVRGGALHHARDKLVLPVRKKYL